MNVHPAATETFLSGSYCDYWRAVYLSFWWYSIRIYTAYLLHNITETGNISPVTPPFTGVGEPDGSPASVHSGSSHRTRTTQ